MVTPVPIPNTAVKHPGPMVVCSHARVGDRRIIDKARWPTPAGFCFALLIRQVSFHRIQASSGNESVMMVECNERRKSAHIKRRLLWNALKEPGKTAKLCSMTP